MVGATLKLTAYTVKTMEIHGDLIVGGVARRPLADRENRNIPQWAAEIRTIHFPKFLSDLLNATNHGKAMQFIRNNGVVDTSAVLETAFKEAPAAAKLAREKIARSGLIPFAVPIKSIYGARLEARKMLDLKEAAAGMDTLALHARLTLRVALTSGMQGAVLAVLDNDSDLSLSIFARNLQAAVSLAVLGEGLNPQIRPCIKCGGYFEKSRKKQLFCSSNCKSAFHVAKQREKAKSLDPHARRRVPAKAQSGKSGNSQKRVPRLPR
jgi:hypothetical protein